MPLSSFAGETKADSAKVTQLAAALLPVINRLTEIRKVLQRQNHHPAMLRDDIGTLLERAQNMHQVALQYDELENGEALEAIKGRCGEIEAEFIRLVTQMAAAFVEPGEIR